MSLYGMVCGLHETAPIAMRIIGLHPDDFARFRDAYFRWRDDKPDTEPVVVVLARLGGGNREAYGEVIAKLQADPSYLHDADCEFDSTFAEFFFSIKYPDLVESTKNYLRTAGPAPSFKERWEHGMARLNAGSANNDP